MAHPKAVLIPLPHYGFDPTESAVPWSALQKAGHRIVFSTPDGQPAETDRRMLLGVDLPVLLRTTLMSDRAAVACYDQMRVSDAFKHPIAYDAVTPSDYAALLLPGGHDKGMRPYLESQALQRVVAHFFDQNKAVGAICHGVLLAARSSSREGVRPGKSVLWGRKTTGLTRAQEMMGYWLTRYKLGDYYRTYPIAMADEVKSLLESGDDFDPGPGWPVPMRRDSLTNLSPGFVVRDDRYLSARWPGDANRFASAFVAMLTE